MKTREAIDFPRRGFVYRVHFDPALGHEIKKTRPALVVSNDRMNQFSRTVLVMPITSGKFQYFFRVPLHPPEGGLTKRSVIATEQIRAIDKQRFKGKVGQVSFDTMKKVEQTIRDHFGLPEGSILT